MANRLYDYARNEFAKGLLHWSTTGAPDTFKCFLVSSNYVADSTNHDFLDDVGGANLKGNSGSSAIANAPTLALIEPVSGVCDAADVTFTSVSTGADLTQLVIFKEGATYSNSMLVAIFDTATGLPVTPNGGNITVTWDSGANKIFKL